MNIIKNFLIIVSSFLIIIIILEITLRITGSKPRIDNLGRDGDPTIYQNDEELGWSQKPGTYSFEPWSDEGKITRFQDTTTMSAGMKSGRVDVIVEATSTIRLMYEELDSSKFERVSSWSKPSNYSGSITFFAAYPFSLDATDLKDAFDSRLEVMLANGQVNEITGKYGFGQADRPAAGDPSIQEICAG